MEVTIDRAGRLVLPKRFREVLGVGTGGTVHLELVDGSVMVSAPVVATRVVERNGRAVVVSDQELPPLTDDVVGGVIDAVHR